MLRSGLWVSQSITDSVFLSMFFFLLLLLFSLKNEDVADENFSRCFMMDLNLAVLFCVHNLVNFGKISNTTGDADPNHDRASVMFYSWLYIVIVLPLSWPALHILSSFHLDHFLWTVFKSSSSSSSSSFFFPLNCWRTHKLRFANLSANNSLGITLQKCCLSKLCYLFS